MTVACASNCPIQPRDPSAATPFTNNPSPTRSYNCATKRPGGTASKTGPALPSRSNHWPAQAPAAMSDAVTREPWPVFSRR